MLCSLVFSELLEERVSLRLLRLNLLRGELSQPLLFGCVDHLVNRCLTLLVFSGNSVVDRLLPQLVLRERICAIVQQCFHHFAIVPLDSEHQRRHTRLRAHVEVKDLAVLLQDPGSRLASVVALDEVVQHAPPHHVSHVDV